MSKLVAIMSVSLDGYVADRNDGVAEVFDRYFNSGDCPSRERCRAWRLRGSVAQTEILLARTCYGA